MHKQLKMSATPIALVALTTSVAVVADAVKAETPAPRPITNESQLIREIGNDPLNVRVVQPVSQVTSVSQLSDVRPTDWAFTALQSLVERYNCIAGYPDRTYRGQQAMTRFEFAAGLNACLDKINEVIASGLADKVSKEDLEVIARLQEDFAAELASLRGRVDTLEGKVATLERQQFSTTTKLSGEVIFAPFFGTDGSGAVPPAGVPAAAIPGIGGAPFGASDRSNLAFGARARLNFDTSFTGRDLLRTRLQVGSVTQVLTALNSGASTRLGFDTGAAPTNFVVDDFFYRFPIGNTTVWVAANLGADAVINPLSPVESSGGGSVSRFGRYPAAIRIGGTQFLLGTRFVLPQGQLNLMYGSNNPSGVAGEGGIFAGGNSKLAAQIVWQPTRDLDLGFTYSYDYLSTNSLGSGTNTAGEVLPGAATMNANTILGQLRWSFARNVNLFVWGSWTFANTLAPAAAPLGQTNANNTGTFTSWMAGLSFADLLGRGDLAAIMFGQPFYLSSFSTTRPPALISPFTSQFYTTPYHLEAFYRFRVTGNISITPAIFFVFNPNNDSRNGTATVGVLRTTFTF